MATKNEIGSSLFAKAAMDRQVEQQTIKAAIDNTGKENTPVKEAKEKTTAKATPAARKETPAEEKPKRVIVSTPKEDKDVKMERLNLLLPSYIKKYLTVAAAQASIDQERKVSLTDYLCTLVKEDMKKKKK